ncbi:MAG TPA: metallophosphoesterase [Actinomycetota bacterium]
MVRRPAALASIAALWLASCAVQTPARSAPVGDHLAPKTERTYVIAAAGDIVCQGNPSTDPDSCQYDKTSDLLVDTGLTRVLTVGDNQYPTGAYSDFETYYDPTWGRVRRITSPALGNHEYAQDPTATPSGYFRYFGKRVKGPDGLGYYSYDLPNGCTPGQGVCWHLISLSSELCFAPGGCGPASDPANIGPGNLMYEWLKNDLSSHPNRRYACTLAYWHHPLYSFSTGSGATSTVDPLWSLLYSAHADLVLNGHSHNYERWKPQDPNGKLDAASGIREFIVGTGGASKYALQSGPKPPNLAAAQDTSFGILRITLMRSGYTWEWVTAAGQPSFTDTRTKHIVCV